MTTLALPDRQDGRAALSDFQLAPPPATAFDAGQPDMPLASDDDGFAVATKGEAGDRAIPVKLRRFIHPYRLRHLFLPAFNLTRREKGVNAGEYPKLTNNSFGEKS